MEAANNFVKDQTEKRWKILSVLVLTLPLLVLLLRTYSYDGDQWQFGTRAFSVAGPTVWNSLPDRLRDPAVDSEQFRRDLKTYLFAGHSNR